MTPDQLAADLADVAQSVADVVVDTNRRAGELVLVGSQPPVDTGFLASSGGVVADADGFAVVYTARYGPFVHARNPFLARALTEKESAVVDLYFDAVRNAIT